MRVWDRPVRLLHAALILLLPATWWTGGSEGRLHEILGYAAGLVVVLRVLWGFAGSPRARFATWLRGPRATVAYLRRLREGRAPRHVGHNPLGAWMIIALLGCLAALVVTGWLYTTDWLWGYAWLSGLHAALGWLLPALVTVHVVGAVLTGRLHRENLVAAMIHGRTRAPAGDDEP